MNLGYSMDLHCLRYCSNLFGLTRTVLVWFDMGADFCYFFRIAVFKIETRL
jgi:hypothetical protein